MNKSVCGCLVSKYLEWLEAHSHGIETITVFIIFLRRADWKVLVIFPHVLSPYFVARNVEGVELIYRCGQPPPFLCGATHIHCVPTRPKGQK